ncbi:MAG TPA: DUF362 domain-containing protein [Candidatus Deferrimicrobiaceae bacterium]
MDRGGMNRRDFLKLAGGAAGLAAASGSIPAFAKAAPAPHPKGGAVVGAASGPGVAANVRRAIAAVGGIGAFVSRGDVVVLKPNIGWDRKPEQAADTDPELVVAVAELCLSAGAKSVRVFDRTCNEPRRCYVNSGIQDAVERFAAKSGAGRSVQIYHVEDRKFVRTVIPGATAMKEWELYRDALEADKIINLPVAKHHSLAGITLGLKNMMGIMGGNRGQLHFNLADCLVDLQRRIPARLTVIDATRVLLRNGPSGGNLADVKAFNTVFASGNALAADLAAADRIFGFKAADVAHLKKALDSGLWFSSPSAWRIAEG